MQSGIFLIDKPAGFSSAKTISVLKRKLELNKVGHSGTLDPFATGLLVVLSGSATRLASYAESGEKVYQGTFLLGFTSLSHDSTCELIKSENGKIPEFLEVKEAVQKFVGEISQKPPIVSALKVGGRRAYNLARLGEEPNLMSRTVNVASFEVAPLSDTEIHYKIRCSKGTYIRSFARDLGEILECGAVVNTLHRVESWPFSVSTAVKLEAASLTDLRPWTELFPTQKIIETEFAVDMALGDERALRAFELTCKTTAEQVFFKEPFGCRGGVLGRDASGKLKFLVLVQK